jgi:hypothetical protein
VACVVSWLGGEVRGQPRGGRKALRGSACSLCAQVCKRVGISRQQASCESQGEGGSQGADEARRTPCPPQPRAPAQAGAAFRPRQVHAGRRGASGGGREGGRQTGRVESRGRGEAVARAGLASRVPRLPRPPGGGGHGGRRGGRGHAGSAGRGGHIVGVRALGCALAAHVASHPRRRRRVGQRSSGGGLGVGSG